MTTRTRAPAAAPTRLALGTVLAAASLTIMAAAIIAPSLPAMGERYAGVPGADLLVRLALTVTSLAIAVSAPISGLVADRVGRRPLLVSGLVLYAVSGTAGFFVTDLYLLLVTRALLGVAVGGIMTAVTATIADWFDGPRRAAVLGLQQAFASLGGVVFLPLAGLLAAVSWRAPFWLYSASAAVALCAAIALREEPRSEEPRGERAPVEPGPGLSRRVIGLYALTLLATLLFYMAPTQLPFLLDDLGSGPAATGALISASMLTSVGGALVFPRLRLTSTMITVVSVALLGAGWLLVGTLGTVPGVLAGLLVGGAGVGLVVPNLNLRLSRLARPEQRGRVLSGLVTGIFLGQFLSPPVVQPLVHATGIAGAFAWSGAAMVAGAAIAAVITTRKEALR